MEKVLLNLAENPCLVIGNGIVLDSLMSELFLQAIDHFYLLETKYNSTTSPALHNQTTYGYIRHFIGLECDLDGVIRGQEGYHEVQAWFCP